MFFCTWHHRKNHISLLLIMLDWNDKMPRISKKLIKILKCGINYSNTQLPQNQPNVLVIQQVPPHNGVAPAICSDSSNNSYLKAARLWFNFLAVSECLQARSSREHIHIGVFLPLAIFGCKLVLLETSDPAGHLPFQSLETKEPDQDRVVGKQERACLQSPCFSCPCQ
jgi:hypothetical protein